MHDMDQNHVISHSLSCMWVMASSWRYSKLYQAFLTTNKSHHPLAKGL